MSALDPTADEIAAAARTIRRSVLPSQIGADGVIDWDASAAVTIGRLDGILTVLADGAHSPDDHDRMIRAARAAIAAHIQRDRHTDADR